LSNPIKEYDNVGKGHVTKYNFPFAKGESIFFFEMPQNFERKTIYASVIPQVTPQEQTIPKINDPSPHLGWVLILGTSCCSSNITLLINHSYIHNPCQVYGTYEILMA
jgi:hypothetical protein